MTRGEILAGRVIAKLTNDTPIDYDDCTKAEKLAMDEFIDSFGMEVEYMLRNKIAYFRHFLKENN